MGRLALLRYSEDQNLTFLRKSICDTIIEYELSQSLNSNFPLTINNDKYIELANSVVELFKREKKELYHEPAYSSQRTVNGKKIIERKNATGLFHNSNERLRDFLRKSNVVNVVNVLRQDNTSIQEEPLELDLSVLEKTTDVLEIGKQKEIEAVWIKSKSHRFTTTFMNQSGLGIINTYGILRTQLAPKLICLDFRDHFSAQYVFNTDEILLSNRLSHKWPILAEQIIAVAKSNCAKLQDKRTSIADPAVIPDYNDLHSVLKANEILQDKGHKNSLAFLLLISLLRRPFKRPKNCTWTLTLGDASKFYIQHIRDHEHFDDGITEHRAKFTDSYFKDLPFAVFCGPLSSLQCCHVVIDDIRYHFNNCIDAKDFLFKFCIVLKIDYPVITTHLWAFFQTHVFEIIKERTVKVKNKQKDKFQIVVGLGGQQEATEVQEEEEVIEDQEEEVLIEAHITPRQKQATNKTQVAGTSQAETTTQAHG
ncbi:uncharacterized protein LOC107981981 [Nasonia vitripennis]|uniref:Uncharacterized protein n=1 Tax=Nasonia vitripennis TaxID=7425 RepID=A0A7M7PZY5_NASVI|nr:uncharacterized protein LOC107981981 [Nasonia vitripennis]